MIRIALVGLAAGAVNMALAIAVAFFIGAIG